MASSARRTSKPSNSSRHCVTSRSSALSSTARIDSLIRYLPGCDRHSSPFQCFDQTVGLNGLGQESLRVHHNVQVLRFTGGDHDHWSVSMMFQGSNARQRFPARTIRQNQIERDGRKPLAAALLVRLSAAPGHFHTIAVRLQDPGEQQSVQALVIDHQDFGSAVAGRGRQRSARQHGEKYASFPRLAVHPYAPPLAFDDALGQRQTKSGPLVTLCRGTVKLLKFDEKPRHVLFRDSDSRVGYLKAKLGGAFEFQANYYTSSLAGEFHRVRQIVIEHLPKPAGVGRHLVHPGIDLGFDLDALLGG